MKRSQKNSDPWAAATWKGAELDQMRRWQALSLKEKLQAIENMGRLANHFSRLRHQQGLSYFDPATKKLVPGRRIKQASTV